MATEHDTKSVITRQTSFVSDSIETITTTIDGKETSALRTGIQLNTKSNARNSWESCYYCTRENFKTVAEFVK